jgi:hypothetical protein
MHVRERVSKVWKMGRLTRIPTAHFGDQLVIRKYKEETYHSYVFLLPNPQIPFVLFYFELSRESVREGSH